MRHGAQTSRAAQKGREASGDFLAGLAAAHLIAGTSTKVPHTPLQFVPWRRSIAPMWMRIALCLCLLPKPLVAAEVTIAVAANFLTTARALVNMYEAQNDDQVVLVHGSTGRLAAQIFQGAPFDVFLSADSARPKDLAGAGRTILVAPYAIGRLIFVTRAASGDWPEVLDTNTPIALANPALAPYGVAAEAALDAAGHDAASLELILGDSVGQVAGFLVTGNVTQGFVAAAQAPLLPEEFRSLPVPVTDDLLVQSAALLSDEPAARAIFDWLLADEARGLIASSGYDLPDAAKE